MSNGNGGDNGGGDTGAPHEPVGFGSGGLKIDDKTSDLFKQAFDSIYKLLTDAHTPDIMAAAIAAVWACTVLMLNYMTPIVVNLVVGLGAKIGFQIVQILAAMRNKPSQDMNDLIAEVSGEFFGADFDSSNMSTAVGATANTDRARAIGADILGLLEGEFAPDGEINEQQGLEGAQAFAGFATNFAVRSALLAILGEFASWGKIDAFRELGSEIARNLSIGRQVRVALRPLFQITIAEPLTWHLNAKYRPTLLTPAEAIKAFFGDQYDEADIAQNLTRHGYSDDDQKALIAGARPQLSPSQAIRAMFRGLLDQKDVFDDLTQRGYSAEQVNALILDAQAQVDIADIERLVRWGVWDEPAAIAHLEMRGFTEQDAKAVLTASQLSRADTHVDAYVGEIAKQRLDGFISGGDFRTLLDEAPLNEFERQWIENETGQFVETPHKVLTIAQMKHAFEQGLVDLDQWDEFLKTEGYSQDEQDILSQSVLLDLAKIEDAKKKAAAAAAKKASVPKKPPQPPPSA